MLQQTKTQLSHHRFDHIFQITSRAKSSIQFTFVSQDIYIYEMETNETRTKPNYKLEKQANNIIFCFLFCLAAGWKCFCCCCSFCFGLKTTTSTQLRINSTTMRRDETCCYTIPHTHTHTMTQGHKAQKHSTHTKSWSNRLPKPQIR